ncbi:MAG: CehA/McbA family metallohydrolase [Christensenellaceae bacterium]|jgi:hypothetical protein|nr:CehA/McbA family metallohydrolase [Christensenellaceae bacterium]
MDKKTISIEYHVEKHMQKQYIRIPFEMPENVEQMDLSYTYEGMDANSAPLGEKNVIDLAIISSDGVDVGATGSSYKSISISETFSSPGYKRCKLSCGTWYILLGAYLLKSNGTLVHYDITFHFKSLRPYKGDPHVHSINSDGKLSYQELAHQARKRKLDFIILTDHNFTPQDALPSYSDLTIIPGVELTNYSGHINYWGVTQPYTGSYAANSFDEFLKLNEEAGGAGAVRVVNHPSCSFCPWKWDLNFPLEGMEIWNGPMRQDNLNAIKLWDSELRKGRRLFPTGGADFHSMPLLLFAKPTTTVYAMSRSPSDILEGFLKGQVTMGATHKTPRLLISSGNIIAGGEVKLTNDTIATITCAKLKRKQTLIIYDQSGEIYRKKATQTAFFETSIHVTKPGFVRAEVRFKKNPISALLYRLFQKITHAPDIKNPLPLFVCSATSAIFFTD